MNRSLLNLTVDLLAAACLLAMVATGYILRFPLPPGTNRTHELWDLSRHQWGSIHGWAGVGLLAVLCLHVVLHWEWLFAMIHRRLTKSPAAPAARRRAAVVAIAVLMTAGGLFGWAAHVGVRELDTPLHPLRGPEEAATTPSDRYSDTAAVDFQRDVRPIFEASCIRCHGSSRQLAGFRTDRREDFFAPGVAAPLIMPGDPARSRLIAIVSGEVKDMKSAKAHLLPPPEIALLKAWIDAGADWPAEPRTLQTRENP
jgi:mono/diheme cytochrome c family protein